MLVPSGIHAKLSHSSKCKISPQSPLFSRFHLKNHPLDSTKTLIFMSLTCAPARS